MIDRRHRTRLPITSQVWFFPTLIVLMPLLSRACMGGVERRPAENEQICASRYELCVGDCSRDAGGYFDQCVQSCKDEYYQCLASPAESDVSGDWSCDSSDDDDDDDDGLSCSADY